MAYYLAIKEKEILPFVTTLVDPEGIMLSELREMMMDREAWRAEIHGVTKSRTRLRD